MGGTLYQDIPTQHPRAVALQHSQKAASNAATHSVAVEAGSRLAAALGTERVWVNSFHHQAVDRVAPGFGITARAEDGVVEAIEAQASTWAMGVQWHPELMTQVDAGAAALLAAFVQACKD